MADAGLGAVIVKALIEQGIPLLAGGGAWAAYTNLVAKNPLNNADFRIKTEDTNVSIEPDPANGRQARVRVRRNFTLKLRDEKKKGRYGLHVDLNGNNVEGRWEDGCTVYLDEDKPFEISFEKERSVIKAKSARLTKEHTLTVKLHSVERISKSRGFYALAISNPKDPTNFRWDVGSSVHGVHGSARAFASSEDFDLLVLRPGENQNIYASLHQVTYFITWSEFK